MHAPESQGVGLITACSAVLRVRRLLFTHSHLTRHASCCRSSLQLVHTPEVQGGGLVAACRSCFAHGPLLLLRCACGCVSCACCVSIVSLCMLYIFVFVCVCVCVCVCVYVCACVCVCHCSCLPRCLFVMMPIKFAKDYANMVCRLFFLF